MNSALLADLLTDVGQLIHDHWTRAAFPLVCLAGGWWWGRRRSRREWGTRQFLHRLNVSLNTVHKGRLLIRTVAEKPLEEIMHNATAVNLVLAAARKTTADSPILPLPQEETWHLLNAVLNELSAQFAVGYLKRDMGGEVTSRRYLLCLTCEVGEEMRTRKVRVMLIQKELLLQLHEQVELEAPRLRMRQRTMKQLAEAYTRQPDQFLEFEICV